MLYIEKGGKEIESWRKELESQSLEAVGALLRE
jgi:hypothetical protein